MIAACSCLCGGSGNLIRNFLHSAGYSGWMSIPIHQGKEKSLALLNQLPPSPEKEMLQAFLKNSSKWAVIIGTDGKDCRWSNIASNDINSKIEAEFVVKAFA